MIKKLNMDCSIQLGDLVIGPNDNLNIDQNHKFIFGNHDSDLSKKHPNCLGNYGYLEKQDIYYISGAFSIDKATRIAKINSCTQEELSDLDFADIFDEIDKYRPRIIVSHDCPDTVRKQLFTIKDFYPNRTSQYLEKVFEIHQPEWWLFGHYHRSAQKCINSTRFICLQELESCEIPDIKW